LASGVLNSQFDVRLVRCNGLAIDENLYDLPPAELAKVPTFCSSPQEAIDSLCADHEFLAKVGVFSKDQIEPYLEMTQEE
jgi:glutamine synthetase